MSEGTVIAYVTTIMREKILSSLLGLALYLGFSPPVAVADVWLRKAGPDHYAEHLPRLREWVKELSG